MSKIKVPPYLNKGDTIAITCPAGYMALEKVNNCIHTLQEWGYRVVVGKTIGSNSDNYFSGTDTERRNEFQQLLDDRSVHAILFGRGGYGMSRIIDQLDFTRFCKHPKWLIGFSDITLLHSHLFSRYGISSMHAPMAGAFNYEINGNTFLESIRKTITGWKQCYEHAPHPMNKTGTSNGKLIGGNLTLLTHVIGTDSDYSAKNKILFLEDVGEYIYSVDRMLYQLKRSGKFDKLNGLIIGGFTDMKDTERPFGKDIITVIREAVEEYSFPVCFNFPVSHERENLALKIGFEYELKVSDNGISLTES